MDLKPGSRWKSAVCDAELVVVRPPKGPVSLECGGHPVVPYGADKPVGLILDPNHADGSAAGKRFADKESGLEILCSKAGAGSPSVDARAIAVKAAKKLPSSD